MPIKTRRWTDPVGPEDGDDGQRVLVCRYRPRGVAREAETWDAFWPDLGPSRELHAAFYGKQGAPIGWEEYRRRYLDEMRGQAQRIAFLARMLAAGETLTLLCSSACTDPARCHRSLLAGLIETQAQAELKAQDEVKAKGEVKVKAREQTAQVAQRNDGGAGIWRTGKA